MKVIWSADALESLRQIEADWNAFNPTSGTHWVARLHAAVAKLADMPRRHRMIQEFSDESLRECIVGPYRVWYHLVEELDEVHVLVIFHGARNVPD